MTALIERHMLARAVGRIMGCMAVTRNHCMPEGAEDTTKPIRAECQ